MQCVKLGFIEGLQKVQIPAISIFRVWNWQTIIRFFVRPTYGSNPRVDRRRGRLLGFMGAEEMEGVNNSSQLRTLHSDFGLSCSDSG